VNLCKGIYYLLEAARLLESEPIRFVVAGPVRISGDAVRSAPRNVRFVGRVQRADAERWYASASVFVHPTLSDGFGITQLEAMAHGLPVVTTHRCGAVVTEGVNGLIVPPGDAPALAAALSQLQSQPGLRRQMSEKALFTARRFTRAAYVARLDEALERMLGRR
jgi:glycosyltransferase involved in cell wall biosynthesis